jgi:hypothetical protein
MKQQIKSLLALLLTLVFLSISITAQAAGSSQIVLSTTQTSLKIGQLTTVDVLVKASPSIYGADIQVNFDPKMLEVVDADKKLAGLQIEPGKFIDQKKSFLLKHQVSNEAGTIDYALTLLNPAPAVQGDGQLARITFRAKSNGLTIISLKKGMFGTKTGETISPDLAGVQITVGDKKVVSSTPMPKPAGGGQTNNALPLVGLASAGVVTIGLAGAWLWLRRPRLV